MPQDNYSSVAKFFHWTIAFLVILNYVLGLTLDSTSWYDFHKQTGLTILVFMILRLVWRLTRNYPKSLKEISPLEKITAHATVLLLYLLLFIVPIAGILIVQAHGYSLNIWGLIKLPTFIGIQPHKTIFIIHKWGAHAIIFLVVLHIIAALKHHFINKNRVLLRMLPFARDK